MLKRITYSRNLILISTIMLVLVGPEVIYDVLGSYVDKSVCLDLEDIEDDFDDEVKLKKLLEKNTFLLLSGYRIDFDNDLHQNDDLTFDDYSNIFGPPPDNI